MKVLLHLTLSLYLFVVNGCNAIDPNNQSNADNKIIMTIEPRLDVDENGYYHLTLDRNNWQTIHRVSGHLNYDDGSPAELVKVYWLSNLYWVLGDTLGYIVHEGLTDDLVYVTYDTTYITGFNGMEVPTSNQASYSNAEGEVNNMIAPVQTMIGDTMTLFWSYYDEGQLYEESIKIILE
ncbi:MAG: hypothetical protein HOK94_04545 [Candidatus Marinimicrobia bacterium]|jgi:hypothetical protein|nr:hypothetical protein [Candidatus Neomarinimicrobiota bacterium]MBT4283124.1 hypothetical protein [Candidatus Neomarinimicrobiota bacterium]MBT4734856.1 hypothetical protein [Candidatus Neomarinimicrobiota bacterium]MBT5460899.1 hypothetical protein [Candidatus Neomarinimicrobiota bacterium]MBT6129255.1 hypothetical protein [Candidatus Neomarinimicrobiota bacterium]